MEKGLDEDNSLKRDDIISVGVDGYTDPPGLSFFPNNKMLFMFGRLPKNQDEENYGTDFRIANKCNKISRNQFAIQVKYQRFTANEFRVQYLFKELSQLRNSYLKVEKKPYTLLNNMII